VGCNIPVWMGALFKNGTGPNSFGKPLSPIHRQHIPAEARGGPSGGEIERDGATVGITENDIANYRATIKQVLAMLFKLKFKEWWDNKI
jgi:hypothetical protein